MTDNTWLHLLQTLKVNDFVTYTCSTRRTGGILFRVSEVQLPLTPTKKTFTLSDGYQYEQTVYVDSFGKKALKSARKGYVRLKPAFEFYPFSNFSLGKNDSGFIVTEYDLENIKHVDMLELLQKFQDFQRFITMFVSKTPESD